MVRLQDIIPCIWRLFLVCDIPRGASGPCLTLPRGKNRKPAPYKGLNVTDSEFLKTVPRAGTAPEAWSHEERFLKMGLLDWFTTQQCCPAVSECTNTSARASTSNKQQTAGEKQRPKYDALVTVQTDLIKQFSSLRKYNISHHYTDSWTVVFNQSIIQCVLSQEWVRVKVVYTAMIPKGITFNSQWSGKVLNDDKA